VQKIVIIVEEQEKLLLDGLVAKGHFVIEISREVTWRQKNKE
jgi:hypothetical protein